MPTRPTLISRLRAWLAQVLAVPPGKPDDGLVEFSAGTERDKPWSELSREFSDALEAWRFNPLARRIVGLVITYMLSLAAIQVQVQQHFRRLWIIQLAISWPAMFNERALARAGSIGYTDGFSADRQTVSGAKTNWRNRS